MNCKILDGALYIVSISESDVLASRDHLGCAYELTLQNPQTVFELELSA